MAFSESVGCVLTLLKAPVAQVNFHHCPLHPDFIDCLPSAVARDCKNFDSILKAASRRERINYTFEAFPIDISLEEMGVVIRYTGAVTSTEMSLSAAQLQGSAKFGDIKFVIHDLTDCESLITDSFELTQMVLRASVALEGHRYIAVTFVGTHLELFEAFRHFKKVGNYKRDLHIFASLPQARTFIAKASDNVVG
jgi:hypothetical protein